MPRRVAGRVWLISGGEQVSRGGLAPRGGFGHPQRGGNRGTIVKLFRAGVMTGITRTPSIGPGPTTRCTGGTLHTPGEFVARLRSGITRMSETLNGKPGGERKIGLADPPSRIVWHARTDDDHLFQGDAFGKEGADRTVRRLGHEAIG